MEGKEENNLSSGVTVKRDEAAPDIFKVAPHVENSSPFPGPTVAASATAATPSPVTTTSVPVSGSSATGTEGKKKRGRPRKYGPDGTVAMPLSPMPISASIPMTGEYSAWKRGRGRPVDSIKKSPKLEYESPAEKISFFVGANFTPHVLTINAGEDVTMKVMKFSQQESRAICILSATGTISNVTLRHPTSSGGTVTYEGRFEILSLSGSFLPTDFGGTKSRSGGMSVSLAGPDGRVVGGGLAGLLVAAGPVQLVVGSFLPGHQLEQKHKKQRTDPAPVTVVVTQGGGYSEVKPILTPASLNPMQGYRNLAADNKTSSPDEDSKDRSQSNCEESC
ncbi:hypothetical protein LWI28_017621 [Acer negundo]|uniref:AT-hook motif nuclear-localized protein n=1 Tax=Acer negundo TaxID=4023 RepID=A0AAD5NI80_ACENE|nr:hypothetical protein LWI28_017621 [Acer negundo]KAK4838123.1 hypothetical protein QYF36_011215 [Acer negundo]